MTSPTEYDDPALSVPPVRSITIIGRVWGPDRNGNSHFGATILVNGEPVGVLDPQYGYGDQYLWDAFHWLDEHDFTDGRGATGAKHQPEGPSRYCQRRGITLHYEAIRVGRKKDL